jgi:hypothetical protein
MQYRIYANALASAESVHMLNQALVLEGKSIILYLFIY